MSAQKSLPLFLPGKKNSLYRAGGLHCWSEPTERAACDVLRCAKETHDRLMHL